MIMHTLEERLRDQEILIEELVKELNSQNVSPRPGCIKNVDVEDIEISMHGGFLFASGGSGFVVIDLSQANTSCFYERDGNPAVVSVWNEDIGESALASTELVIAFDSNEEAKDYYKIIGTELNKHREGY